MNRILVLAARVIGFPIMALCLGFLLAFLALRFDTLFFVLLPLAAFVFGYYSSWDVGALSGIALFVSYTFATTIMWWGIDNSNTFLPWGYVYAFFAGGFTLIMIGALAYKVKHNFRSVACRLVLASTAIITLICGFAAVTHYGYYYQVDLQCSENLEKLEIYLPLGAVDGKPYVSLLNSAFIMPGEGMTEDYTTEVVQTEYGPMLKIAIHGLVWRKSPDLPYTANIILWQKCAPSKLIQLMPKLEVTGSNSVDWSQSFAGITTRESKSVESYSVPLKFVSDKQANVKLTLWNRTDRVAGINFAFTKSTTYTELVQYEGSIADEWIFASAKATVTLEVSGGGD
jgi:hypothetical protein